MRRSSWSLQPVVSWPQTGSSASVAHPTQSHAARAVLTVGVGAAGRDETKFRVQFHEPHPSQLFDLPKACPCAFRCSPALFTPPVGMLSRFSASRLHADGCCGDQQPHAAHATSAGGVASVYSAQGYKPHEVSSHCVGIWLTYIHHRTGSREHLACCVSCCRRPHSVREQAR